MKQVEFKTVSLGCDPEFFFSKNGKIIGSEKVIDEEDLDAEENRVIIDGVQAEINPEPSTCRQTLAGNIADCFDVIDDIARRKKVKVDSSQNIKIEPQELLALSEKSRQFGCAPSKNKDKNNKIRIKDASKYYYRSAGGHIHIGYTGDGWFTKGVTHKALLNHKVMIPILDIIVGNTCVLIDRDKGNKIRRKTYGRAGEYRTPKYGLEYRTLSNFWLRDYKLMSFVMGLTRMAVNIVTSSTKSHNFAKMLIKAVNMKDVNNAINNNNFTLAMKNFNKITPILNEIIPSDCGYNDDGEGRGNSAEDDESFSLHEGNIKYFKHFVKKGIDYWFENKNIVDNWINFSTDEGWELFVATEVKDDYEKDFLKRHK